MRVLVTGNLGYIGPVVVRHLKEAGHYVVGLDRGWYIAQYAGEPEWPHVQRFTDIRKHDEAYARQFDAIVHMAGLSNDPIGDLDPDLTRGINYAGTIGWLTPGVRNVILSSCSVYGSTDGIATEATPLLPLTAYADSKARVDAYAAGFLSKPGEWASLRLGTVFGYSPGHRLDLVVNRMMHDALNKGRVLATGNAARPLVHVEDVARAVVHFVEQREWYGVYNIVGDNIRMHALGEAVASFCGVPHVKVESGPDARDYMASAEKARLAGWTPTRTVEGSLPVLAEKTLSLPKDRIYERLPIARRHLGLEAAA